MTNDTQLQLDSARKQIEGLGAALAGTAERVDAAAKAAADRAAAAVQERYKAPMELLRGSLDLLEGAVVALGIELSLARSGRSRSDAIARAHRSLAGAEAGVVAAARMVLAEHDAANFNEAATRA